MAAEYAADRYMWRAPFTIELQTCGESNAHWDVSTHKLTMCYEMAEEYLQLHLDYYADAFKIAVGPPSPPDARQPDARPTRRALRPWPRIGP